MTQRSVEDGRLVIPDHWPKWALKCQAQRRHGRGPCNNWATMGNRTCKFHGSGGEKMRQSGQLRYLAWIITGGCQHDQMGAEPWSRLALATIFEMVLNQGKGTLDQQLKAALWLTEMLS